MMSELGKKLKSTRLSGMHPQEPTFDGPPRMTEKCQNRKS